jgi:hypothetical protein
MKSTSPMVTPRFLAMRLAEIPFLWSSVTRAFKAPGSRRGLWVSASLPFSLVLTADP